MRLFIDHNYGKFWLMSEPLVGDLIVFPSSNVTSTELVYHQLAQW